MKKHDEIDFSRINLDTIGTEKSKNQVFTERLTLTDEDASENQQILQTAFDYYSSMAKYRKETVRCRKYASGDQWHEIIEHPETGETMTEEDYIKSRGKIPLKQNVIRQMVKNLLGQYRSNPTKPIITARDRKKAKVVDMLNVALRGVGDANVLEEMLVRNFEEFINGGLVVGKIGYDFDDERDREDVTYDNIDTARIFFNTDVSDVRFKDLTMIGEIIDANIDDIIGMFAKNETDAAKIRSWYGNIEGIQPTASFNAMTADRSDAVDFYTPSDQHKCRVIEVWKKESAWRTIIHDYADGTETSTTMTMQEVAKENTARIELATKQGIPFEKIPLMDARRRYESFWTVRMLTPYGQTLFQAETPYLHQGHPYVIRAYPFIKGEVWGLVKDIIDQQRYINRLISMIDFIMGNSAKGVLMIPETAVKDDAALQKIAQEWSKADGVIMYTPKAGVEMPKQISANSTNIGAQEMLALQMRLMQDISGVHGAIQGKSPSSGTPSSLYAQEAQNATINSKDFMDSYNWFKRDVYMKILKNIVQFYDSERYITTAGGDFDEEAKLYKPDLVKDLEFTVGISQSADTPVFRQLIDDALFKLLESQSIDLKMFLENSSLPFAEKLLESIKQKEEQGQVGMPTEEQIAEIQKNANPEAMELVNQMAGKRVAA